MAAGLIQSFLNIPLLYLVVLGNVKASTQHTHWLFLQLYRESNPQSQGRQDGVNVQRDELQGQRSEAAAPYYTPGSSPRAPHWRR